jgi:hypothetical protein
METQTIAMLVGLAVLIGFFIAVAKVQNKEREREEQEKREKAERQEQEKREKAERQEEERRQVERLIAMNELRRQAEIMGDTDCVEQVNNMTYHGPLPERRTDGAWTSVYDDLRILKIAGMQYRGNLSAYEGNFRGVLVPEPKNEYDPFAIMVKVEDGKHVGYIKEEQTDMVRTWVGAEQLGTDEPTIFKPYRICGTITSEEDYDNKKSFDGCVYIKKA